MEGGTGLRDSGLFFKIWEYCFEPPKSCRVAFREDPRTPFYAALGLAFFYAWASCVVSSSEETPEPPFSAALGLAVALGSTFFGVLQV